MNQVEPLQITLLTNSATNRIRLCENCVRHYGSLYKHLQLDLSRIYKYFLNQLMLNQLSYNRFHL